MSDTVSPQTPLTTIDATGCHVPAFVAVYAYVQEQYRGIYGSDVNLDNSTQDGQWLGILALAVQDCNNAVLAAYNAYSVSGAVGSGLSSIVKLNGLGRQGQSDSTVDVTITGAIGTTVPAGILQDEAQRLWGLPPNVVVPGTGSITVTAACQTAGPQALAANENWTIRTPVLGWTGVSNAAAAALGADVEKDGALRARQVKGVALPSQTVLDGIVAGVANVPGVTDVIGYENDTTATDSNSVPAHGIAIIAAGGDDAAIAQAIYNKKPPGTPTYGTTTVSVTSRFGVVRPVSFLRPVPITTFVHINLRALGGYVSSTQTVIAQALADYVNGLDIGRQQYLSRVEAVGTLLFSRPDLAQTFTILSVTQARVVNTPTAADIAIAFAEKATLDPANVSFTVS